MCHSFIIISKKPQRGDILIDNTLIIFFYKLFMCRSCLTAGKPPELCSFFLSFSTNMSPLCGSDRFTDYKHGNSETDESVKRYSFQLFPTNKIRGLLLCLLIDFLLMITIYFVLNAIIDLEILRHLHTASRLNY